MITPSPVPLALVVGCRLLLREVGEVAAAMALSSSAASHLLRDTPRVIGLAQQLATALSHSIPGCPALVAQIRNWVACRNLTR